jgi:hypothetical protein
LVSFLLVVPVVETFSMLSRAIMWVLDLAFRRWMGLEFKDSFVDGVDVSISSEYALAVGVRGVSKRAPLVIAHAWALEVSQIGDSLPPGCSWGHCDIERLG